MRGQTINGFYKCANESERTKISPINSCIVKQHICIFRRTKVNKTDLMDTQPQVGMGPWTQMPSKGPVTQLKPAAA